MLEALSMATILNVLKQPGGGSRLSSKSWEILCSNSALGYRKTKTGSSFIPVYYTAEKISMVAAGNSKI